MGSWTEEDDRIAGASPAPHLPGRSVGDTSRSARNARSVNEVAGRARV